jgi:adenine-specific DNA-methyltransferase
MTSPLPPPPPPPMRSTRSARSTRAAAPGRFAGAGAGKLRGGYYTSPEVAAWLCAWAVRAASDSILEPSCGDGVFLAAAADRLGQLGAGEEAIARQLAGVEIVPAEAEAARERLRRRSARGLGGHSAAAVADGDFFDWWQRPARPRFDAAVGNPPFIRYQTFPEPHRGRAMAILSRLGLEPNRLTNIWVPFVAAATATLVEGGRLALVLPAELLQVSYAAQLRSFLTARFARIDVIACNELFFAGAEQEVVLLLADGARDPAATANGGDAGNVGDAGDTGDACRVALTPIRTAAEVTARPPAAVLAGAVPKAIRHREEKWLQYFLTAREIDLMRELRGAAAVTTLGTHAGVDVGVVTGSNEFFVLSRRRVEELSLEEHVLPLVSRAAQLKGARITAAEWQALAAAGDRVQLLHLGPPKGPRNGAPPAPAVASYIRQGEAGGVHRGYKCSIRSPWYAVPAVWVPDGFVFRQIHDFPRAVRNEAGATSTDTIHRLRCKADSEAVIASLYTHLTAASAEIEGRSYGGGVLELEPTEAERLLMPARLAAALPLAECDRLVRAGRLEQALDENDRLVLAGQMGLSRADCAALRGIWVKMRDRRTSRRRAGRRPRALPPPA